MSQRTAIIADIVAAVKAAAGVEDSEVFLGGIPTKTMTGLPRFAIKPDTDDGEWLDGERTQRTVTVFVGGLIRFDESKPIGRFNQLDEAFSSVHHQLELLTKNNVNGKAQKFQEIPGNPVTFGNLSDDADDYLSVTSAWQFEYVRPLGADS